MRQEFTGKWARTCGTPPSSKIPEELKAILQQIDEMVMISQSRASEIKNFFRRMNQMTEEARNLIKDIEENQS